MINREWPGQDDEGMRVPPVREPTNPGVALTRLRDQLRFRLPVDLDPVGVIDELCRKSLLRNSEASLARDLLSESAHDLLDASASDQRAFVLAAWPFACRLRVVAFDRAVRQRIERCGWSVDPFDQPSDRRPDFAVHKDGQWLRMTARVVDDEGSKTVSRAIAHLTNNRQPPEFPRRPPLSPLSSFLAEHRRQTVRMRDRLA
jgi:hypothetical protein